jgi:hypothetical protein
VVSRPRLIYDGVSDGHDHRFIVGDSSMSLSTPARVIRVGHSPDSDDAFMFYALTHDKLEAGGLTFAHQLEDIETLNRRALKGELEVSAVSIHAFAHLADRYALLASGCSMGDRYGPTLITREPQTLEDVRGKTIAIPGKLTTAYLALQLCFGKDVSVQILPFDQILPAVAEGRAEVGSSSGGSPSCSGRASFTRSTIATKRFRTPSSTPETSIPRSPIDSWACTSTNGPSTTAPRAERPCGCS